MEMFARSGRTPTFILAGLLVVILIISYNFWSSLQANNDLRQQIINLEEKYGELTNKKSELDKEKETNLNRIKFFEERSETHLQAMKKKDDEMTELNKKLNDANNEISNLKRIDEENLGKLKTCDENKSELDKVKSEKTSLTDEISRLTTQVTDLTNKLKAINCDEKVKSELTTVFSKLYVELTDANLRTKLKQAFNFDDKTVELLNLTSTQQQQPQVTQPLVLQKRDNEKVENNSLNQTASLSSNEICSLPKNEGKCNSAIDKYYFDSATKVCSMFKYTGCDGNANNFDTKEICENECLKKIEQTITTPVVVNDQNANKPQEQQQQAQLPLVPNAEIPRKEEIIEVKDNNDEPGKDNAPQNESAKQAVEPHL